MAMLRVPPAVAILIGLAASTAWPAPLAIVTVNPRQDRAWKLYTNAQLGYCISYPKRWQHGNAFDGAGIYAAVTPKHSNFPVGALDVSAFADSEPSLKTVTLTSDVEAHLDGLRRFVKAQHTEVLEQHAFNLPGSDGLYLKARYVDPRERSKWVDEVVFARRNGMLYRLEMQTREDYMPRFTPVFERFARSFQFRCGSRE